MGNWSSRTGTLLASGCNLTYPFTSAQSAKDLSPTCRTHRILETEIQHSKRTMAVL